MKRILLLAMLFIIGSAASAQLADGAIAPDFTATDLDGNEHNLYDLLNEGKTVVLDVMATWCPPCWTYHNTNALKDFMRDYGPDGTDEARVFMIEDDISRTVLSDLYGPAGENTLGDWVTGTNYPIINSENGVFNSKYQIEYFPTVYMICPDRKITQIRSAPINSLVSLLGACPDSDHPPVPSFLADRTSGCGLLEVNFEDDSWPRPDSWFWDFGDGNSSTEQSPSHTYDGPGDYDVTLKVTNEFGEEEETTSSAITIGDGYEFSNVNTGLASNSEPGSGGAFFQGGYHGLIFDALSDFVLSSATVYSDRAAWRTFVVTDNVTSNLIVKRDVYIEEGEHRITLNMTIPAGTDYRIGMWSEANLYRTNTGGGYPHIVEDVVNIKTSTVTNAGVDPSLYYYYLYDWKVRPIACNDFPSAVEENHTTAFTLYPNPAYDQITVESSEADLSQLFVTDISGRIVEVKADQKVNAVTLDLDEVQPGLYLISVGGQTQKFYRQ